MHSYSKVNSPFNEAKPKFKKTLEVKIEKPEAREIKCDVHGWMQAGSWPRRTPYFAVTDGAGSFKLTDVPAGSYTLELWYQKFGKTHPESDREGQRGSEGEFGNRREITSYSIDSQARRPE